VFARLRDGLAALGGRRAALAVVHAPAGARDRTAPLREQRLDEHAAKRSVFGGLAASGWHTTALTMRLLVDSDLRIAGGLIGLGFEELRWPRPVRPGDELRVESLVLEKRESKSRPQQGLLKMRNTTINQHDEPVQLSVGTLIVPRRA
jgi:acyl dehydratase